MIRASDYLCVVGATVEDGGAMRRIDAVIAGPTPDEARRKASEFAERLLVSPGGLYALSIRAVNFTPPGVP